MSPNLGQLVGPARDLFDRVYNEIKGDLWEPNEPCDAEALADAWLGVKTAFEEVRTETNRAAEKIFADWPDPNGLTLKLQINQFNTQVDGLVAGLQSMASYCQNYAAQIYRQRAATIIEMTINAAAFVASLCGGPGGILTGIFVRKVASMVLSRVITAALSIAVEAGEEFVISAGAELASINAGYDRDGFGWKQVAIDASAGAIGGVLGGAVNGVGSGVKNKLVGDSLKPDSKAGQVLAQHGTALVQGGAVNGVVSPVSSTLAQGAFEGDLPSLGELKQSVKDGFVTAAASGSMRANGVTLGSQIGHGTGLASVVESGLESRFGDTGTNNDNTPPPDGGGPDPTVAAEAESAGGAGQGAVGAETGAAAGQGAAGAESGGVAGQGAESGGAAGQGATGAEADGAAGRGTTGQGTTDSGGPRATRTVSTGSAEVNPESGLSGTETTTTEAADPAATGNVESTAVGEAAQAEQRGSVEHGAEQGNPGAPGESGNVTGAETETNTTEGSAPVAAGTTTGTTESAAGMTTAPGSAVTVNQPGVIAPPGRNDPASSRRTGTVSTSESATAEQEPALASEPGTESTSDPDAEAAAESAPDQVAEDQTRPEEITATVWQRLAPVLRNKITEVFAAASPRKRDAVAALVALEVSTDHKKDIVAMAGRTPASVLESLVTIAKHSPETLARVIREARKATGTSNQVVRDIAGIVRNDPDALAAYLEQAGLTSEEGTKRHRPGDYAENTALEPQTEPWARFPLPDNHDIPQDARMARRRDMDRMFEANQVREHIRPALQQALDEAAATLAARPESRRYSAGRGQPVADALAKREAATEQRRKAVAEGADQDTLKRLRAAERAAVTEYISARARADGAEIHVIFEATVQREQARILGEHAGTYRLRVEAPYGFNGRVRYPGKVRPDLVLERMSPDGKVWYTAHTYDVKTGDATIRSLWALQVDRYARGLFEVEELRPAAPRPAATPGDPPPAGPSSNQAADPTAYGADPNSPSAPSAPSATGPRDFHRKADDVRAKLDQLADHGVDIEQARIALLALRMRAAGLTAAPELDTRGLLDLQALADVAMSLTNLHPALCKRMGLPGLEVHGLRAGPAGTGISGRIDGGREVRIEVRDRPAFTTDSPVHAELTGRLTRHREQLGADGLVVTLLTDDQPAADSPAGVNSDDVADALVAVGADMVLRYDGFDTYVVLAEQPTPVDIAAPKQAPLRAAGQMDRVLSFLSSLSVKTQALVLNTQIAQALFQRERIERIALSTLRAADRYAGMTGVVPPSGDDTAYRITFGDKEFSASARVGELDDGVAARYVVHRGAVEITVSNLAAPRSVPALVAAALAEAAAELTGQARQRADFLVRDSEGDRVLSRRDYGRAAQLLAYSTQLNANPFQYQVRRQLRTLIEDMGLDPAAKGVSGRKGVLPDQRMRDALNRYPELGGPPSTLAHFARSAAPWLVSTALLSYFAPAMAAALASVSLGRLVMDTLTVRPMALRNDAVSDQQFAPANRALADANKGDLGVALLRFAEQRVRPSVNGDHARAATGEAPAGPKPMTPQFGRMSGLSQYPAALGGAVGLGATAFIFGLDPVVGAGILVTLAVPAMIVPLAVVRAKRYTLAWKLGMKAGTKATIDKFLADNRNRIVEQAKPLDQETWHELARSLAQPDVTEKVLKKLMFWFSDGMAGQVGHMGVPKPESKDIAGDPTKFAEDVPHWIEHLMFRSGNTLANLTVNLIIQAKVFAAQQKAGANRGAHDQFQEAKRDLKWFADRAAKLEGEELAADPALEPLAQDETRPPGQPKWWGWQLVADIAAGVLAIGVAVAAEAALGMHNALRGAVGGVANPVVDTFSGRRLTAVEQQRADQKAEVTRVSAADDRSDQAAAIDAFLEHLHEGSSTLRPPETGDGDVGRILAEQHSAYRVLVADARRLVRTPGASFTEFGANLVDRICTLHDVGVKAGKLAETTLRTKGHRQDRAEVAARNSLVSAIQKHNVVVARINQSRAGSFVPMMSAAPFIDGVHAGNTDRARLHEQLPDLPVVPADANGQVAAVLMDQRFDDPAYQAPDDLATWAGNEGWAARVAAAAGVPSQTFTSFDGVNDIVERLERLGPGSRGIVHAQRKDVGNDVVVSGELVNAVNVGGTVYFIDAGTGAPADMAAHVDGLTMLITEDNGQHAATMADGRRLAQVGALATHVGNKHHDLISGSFLTDPAAPGLPGDREHTTVSAGVDRIASVINPSLVAAPRMPLYHAFSDPWEFMEFPPPPPVVAVAAPMDFAGLAVAMLATYGDPQVAAMPEYTALKNLLAQKDTPPDQLYAAMDALRDKLLEGRPGTGP